MTKNTKGEFLIMTHKGEEEVGCNNNRSFPHWNDIYSNEKSIGSLPWYNEDLVNVVGSGQIVCPNGQSSSGSLFVEGFERSDGQWDGGFTILVGGESQKSGVITDGHVTPSRFTVEGTETTDIFCAEFGGGIATTVSIKGQCDDNVTIQFRAANGQRGTFVGDVECARLSKLEQN